MLEYRTSAQAIFDIKYHFVWITKHRYKILRGADSRACARPAEGDLSSQGGGDHTRCGGTGSDAHAGVGAAGHGAGQVGAVSERAGIAEAPRRIFGNCASATGAALVSAGLFLRECGRGGRGNDQEIH
jgi:hypothetical protein